MTARDTLDEVDPDLADRVAAYRAGYLPEERRALEDALRAGALLGVATTNALELGVDVDRPRRRAAGRLAGHARLAVAAGRAGRARRRRRARGAGRRATTRSTPISCTTRRRCSAPASRRRCCDPTNPYVLGPHLCAAAAELPLTEDDLPTFGPWPREPSSTALVRRGLLRVRPGRLVLDATRARQRPRRPARHRRRHGPRRRGRDRAGARHGRPRRRARDRARRRRLRAPGRDVRRATSSTSTTRWRWRTARTSTGRRRRATRPTSGSSTRSRVAGLGRRRRSCTATSR